MKQPLVSIIMPTYNREKVIERAICSIKNQKYQNWELLIIDDGSTDDTKNKVQLLMQQDARIKYFTNNRKKGVSGARNVGLENAVGDYIAFLDSDDEWTQDHLSSSIKILETQEVNVTFALWENDVNGIRSKCDEDSFFVKNYQDAVRKLGPVQNEKYVIWGTDFFEFIILTGFYCYNINTLVCRKETLGKQKFDEQLYSSEDMELIYNLIIANGCCLILEYHYIYYQGDDNLYNFINRSEIDLLELRGNKNLVYKISRDGLSKNRMRKKLIKRIRSLNKTEDLRKCKVSIKDCIGKKYFTLAIINISNNMKLSLLCLIRAIFWKKDIKYLALYRNYYNSKNVNAVCEHMDYY